ncbi:MAG: GntR family transcriptional regulator [Actinomycetota bacterium]|nr:GntR family transcriptional regulator [Actinomycetota bacterium]
MGDTPEPRVSLNEVAYRRLRGEIITCRLAPGQRLTERQLAADLGVSTAPLRDALTRLDHEGLIRTVPFKGYRVAPLTPKSIDDLFMVWRIVGPEVIRLGIAQATEDQLTAARAAFDDVDAQALGDEAAVHDIDLVNTTFGILAEATGNAYLVTIYERLMGDMSRIRALRLTSGEAESSTSSSSHWVRHVLSERDPDRAATEARRYIDEVHRGVLQAVVRWPSVMTSEVSVSESH